MLAEASTPVPKPRRFTFRRVLLAVILGLAAWWGVGWWLTVKPQLLLRFADSGTGTIPGQGYVNASFSVDAEGEDLLRIIRPNVPVAGRLTLDKFNLSTGQRVTSHTFSPDEFFGSPDWRDSLAGNYLLDHRMMSHRLRPFDGFEQLRAYPEWGQSVRMRYTSYGALDPWLRELPGLGNWLYRPTVGIWDNEGSRFLWSVQDSGEEMIRDSSNTDVLTNKTGRFVVVVQTFDQQHEVAVIAMPLPSWSPWWPRSAGLLVAAFVLFARRRHRGLSAA